MEAATQSALLMIWALFWMLALSLLMVHPTFRTTRIRIRRSLRGRINRWRTTRHRVRHHLVRCRTLVCLGLAMALVALAGFLRAKETAPPWRRLLIRLSGRCISGYLFVRLVFGQEPGWKDVLIYLMIMETLDALHNGWRRRRQRLQTAPSGESSTI